MGSLQPSEKSIGGPLGKTTSPLDEKLKAVKWGEFRLGGLFEKLDLKFKKPNFEKNSDVSKIQTEEFSLPLVNAKNGDNGVMYYGRPEDFESAEMTIDIVNDGAVSTGNVYSQPQKTGVLYNAYLIKPKFDATSTILHFFTTAIFKSIKTKFGYEYKASWERVQNEKITLPITNDEKIDFVFIISFIRELEEERIRELEEERIRELAAYLTVSGLADATLTASEEAALLQFKSLEWKEYNIKKLFEIHPYKKCFDANKTKLVENGGHPYIVRTALNNGQKGFIDEDEIYLNDGNTISFGQDTATMFYQELPYFTGDKIKIMKALFPEFNKKIALYLITSMSKVFKQFSWGTSSFSKETISSQIVTLPSKDGNPDYEIMELFISAVQKLVIKDVVQYANQKIAAAKLIINDK